jgi:hypothetical protein
VTGETEVTRPRRRTRVTLATRSACSNRSAPKSRGFAIPNDRFWPKKRRKRDGTDDPPGAGGRSLKDLLKQVEKATQVRRSGLDEVLAELKLHRDGATDPALRSALAWLCNAVSRFLHTPTAPHAREVMLAADAVKRVPAG